MIPTLAYAVWRLLGYDPIEADVLMAKLKAPMEDVYGALVWLEAREHAAMRALPGTWGKELGWVAGRIDMRQAA